STVGASARKIKCFKGKAFFSFSSIEDAKNAIAELNNLEIKGKKLLAKYARPEPLKGHDRSLSCEYVLDKNKNEDSKTIARLCVTPLADLPYDEQLRQKLNQSEKLLSSLVKQLDNASVTSFKPLLLKQRLEPIRPSPRIIGYRNKCEFTVGESTDGSLEVGFVKGKFAENQHYVVPIDNCPNISDQMKRIVAYFKEFITDTGYPPFNEFNREGVWRMLTIREFGCDVMIIATVFPMKQIKDEEVLKKNFSEKFLNPINFFEKRFRVTSVYWQRLENASDEVIYEHIGGARYIYETILDSRFRVSPGAFFQTNTAAAEVLYSTILEKFMSIEENSVGDTADDSTVKTFEKADDLLSDSPEFQKKKPKFLCSNERKHTLLLDICCGTGTIGVCILSSLKRKKMDENVFLLGIELVEAAVKDALHNAHDNFLFEKQCCFIAGEASAIFQSINGILPPNMHLEDSEVIGILDPPRSGVHDSVILGCRTLSNMKHLIYVSCHPSMASKNLTDLCRPTSKKYAGKPFHIESIVPVDMFPQTIHCEWVIKLCR
uniref:tRNA (uracil(54)-C(5))-methyltransferase n=1 Tax=Syphacia muris TaxID=451379 RepID=A0A0N5AN11_9BILA